MRSLGRSRDFGQVLRAMHKYERGPPSRHPNPHPPCGSCRPHAAVGIAAVCLSADSRGCNTCCLSTRCRRYEDYPADTHTHWDVLKKHYDDLVFTAKKR
eukprot:SAG22_NODE_1868_length_3404_cov_67.845688_2_plen_99_part_00